MTKENKKAEQERIRKVAMGNLELGLFQNIAGSNSVQKNPFLYGQLGVQGAEDVYRNTMNGDQVRKLKDEEYNTKVKEGEALGIFGEPTYPTNYEASLKIAKILGESKMVLSLTDLEGIVKGVADGLEFKVPEDLSEYVPQELYSKVAKARASGEKEDGLSEKEKDALIFYQILSQAYDRGIAYKAGKSGYFTDINEAAKKISEKYNKPKKK